VVSGRDGKAVTMVYYRHRDMRMLITAFILYRYPYFIFAALPFVISVLVAFSAFAQTDIKMQRAVIIDHVDA
jgi:hypothetical protein